MPDPLFFEKLEGGSWRCVLCPHRCRIAPGSAGLCRVRAVDASGPALPFWGRVGALASDPIEKKPLYHFRPGSSVFSAGFLSCNLRCPFCQNWSIAARVDAETRLLEPAALADLAVASGTGALALTYSEPLVHIEYLLETMEAAAARRLAVVLVTNGCVEEEAAKILLSRCDAVNVDLKAASASTYEKILGGNLDAVLRFIALAYARDVHVEATTLVVTGMNDSVEEIGRCADYLAEISPDLPFHLSAYHPAHKYREPATDPDLLRRAAAAARKRLSYVYVGNLPEEENETRCPVCGARVIKREGYRVDARLLERDTAGTYRCGVCGAPMPIRG